MNGVRINRSRPVVTSSAFCQVDEAAFQTGKCSFIFIILKNQGTPGSLFLNNYPTSTFSH